MIDESFDTDFVNSPPAPWEFRAKPAWQRIFVLTAGVLMNLVLAVLIFWGINYVQGKTEWVTTEVGVVASGSPAELAGFRNHDVITTVDGTPVSGWEEMLGAVYLASMSGDVRVVVRRNGTQAELVVPRGALPESGPSSLGIIPANTEIHVTAVQPGMPAHNLGLLPDDVLVSLAGTPVRFDRDVLSIVQQHAGKPLEVEWRRTGELMRGTTVPTDDGKIGISFRPRYNGPVRRIEYSILEALPQGAKDIASVSVLFVQQIGHIITGRTSLSQSVGGPIRIAQMATQSAELGVLTYLGFMALLSVSLAILNILPFPALDGGHILIILIEVVARRELPVRVKLGIQKVGFFLLLAFMAFVVYNDILHF
jgi:regulator of sigma E protease